MRVWAPSVVVAIAVAVAVAAPSVDAGQRASKPRTPLTVFVFAAPAPDGAPPSPTAQKETADSVRDLRNALDKRKDWFRTVEDRSDAEMTLEVVKRDYEKGHGFVVRAKMGLLDLYDLDIIGQGGLDQYDFTIWRTAAGDIVSRVETYYAKNLDEFEKARTRAPRPDAVRAADRGDAFARQRNYDEAIREFDAALRTSPQYARAYYLRANAYLDRKEYDKAAADLTEGIRLRPSANAYYARGTVYASLKDRDRAIADLTEALRLDATLPGANFRRGVLLFEAGSYDRAIPDFTDAIRIDANNAADAYYNRGMVYSRKGQIENAIADYGEVMRLKPNDTETLLLRARAHARRNDPTSALADYSRVLQAEPRNAQAWSGRGAIFLDTKEWSRAIADLTEALKLNPGDGDAYFLRGSAHLQRADLDQAIADYTEAVRINPKDAAAFFNRGLAYAKKGIADKAQADRQKAQELDPAIGRPK